MCLITFSKKPLVADTDIPCYKLLVKTNDGRLISPFQEMEYKIVEVNSAVSTVKKPFTIHTATYIEGGYLHGYNIYANIRLISHANFSLHSKGELRLYKGYIPKGTEYYSSTIFLCCKDMFVSNEYKII